MKLNVQRIADSEKDSKKYAEEFFEEEREMEGLFEVDTKILAGVILKKGKLLDASMGPGRHVEYFADRGFQVWGNDFNRHMVRVAKKKLRGKKVKFLNRDMRDLSPLKDNFFDYVLCMGATLGSVYRKSERQKAVNELSRVAKKGGLVFIHVHNLFEITEFADFLGIIKTVKNRLLHPDKFDLGDVIYSHSDSFKQAYMHWFSPKEMGKIMLKAGLRPEKKFFLRGPDQDRLVRCPFTPVRNVLSGGFIFVGRKI